MSYNMNKLHEKIVQSATYLLSSSAKWKLHTELGYAEITSACTNDVSPALVLHVYR